MQGCPLCGVRLLRGPVLDAHIAGELDDLDRAEWTDAAACVSDDATHVGGSGQGKIATTLQLGARHGLVADQRCTSAAAQNSRAGASGSSHAPAPASAMGQRPHGICDTASRRRNRRSTPAQQRGRTGPMRSGGRRQPRDANAVRLPRDTPHAGSRRCFTRYPDLNASKAVLTPHVLSRISWCFLSPEPSCEPGQSVSMCIHRKHSRTVEALSDRAGTLCAGARVGRGGKEIRRLKEALAAAARDPHDSQCRTHLQPLQHRQRHVGEWVDFGRSTEDLSAHPATLTGSENCLSKTAGSECKPEIQRSY